jgi:hypothetical protein
LAPTCRFISDRLFPDGAIVEAIPSLQPAVAIRRYTQVSADWDFATRLDRICGDEATLCIRFVAHTEPAPAI